MFYLYKYKEEFKIILALLLKIIIITSVVKRNEYIRSDNQAKLWSIISFNIVTVISK